MKLRVLRLSYEALLEAPSRNWCAVFRFLNLPCTLLKHMHSTLQKRLANTTPVDLLKNFAEVRKTLIAAGRPDLVAVLEGQAAPTTAQQPTVERNNPRRAQ